MLSPPKFARRSKERPPLYLHVIKDLSKVSGAEIAMLRIASAQKLSNVKVLSLMGSHHEANAFGVEIISLELNNPRKARGKIRSFLRMKRSHEIKGLVSWMYSANILILPFVRFGFVKFPVIWNIRHSLDSLNSEPIRTRLSILLNRFFSFAPRTIVYASRSAMTQHERSGFPKKKSVYIPNGYDAVPSTKALGKESGSPIVLGTIGRIVPAKDIGNLLAAFDLIRAEGHKVVLSLAGSDFEVGNTELQDLLEQFEIHPKEVSLNGFLPDVSSFFRSLDVFVLSSRSEGFPNALAEAMLHGIPSVTTDVGDAAEIGGPFALVVPKQNPAALASAVQDLMMEKPAIIEQRRRGGVAHIQNSYGLERIALAYDKIMVAQ